MILDSQLVFSDAQAITAAAASTNTIDLGAARDIGGGEQFFIVVTVVTAFTDTGSDSTLAVALQTDDNTSFSSATSSQVIGTFSALSAVGTTLYMPIAPARANERYIRLYYTPAGGDLSTGAVDAYIAKDLARFNPYADAITIA